MATKKARKLKTKRKKREPKKPAQVQAWEDIEAGRVEHNKYTCPGCPIH